VLTFGTNTHGQGKNKATAEIFGVVKGADGAPVVLHLRALDDNPVRYYDGYEETAGKDGSFHFAENQRPLPMADRKPAHVFFCG
jgi:hypothetical protein